MPKAKKAKRARPSSELGDGDFASTHNKTSRRAIRKCRSRALDSPFQDSALAVSDPESDDYEEREIGDTIAVVSRKRKRSASPANLQLPSDRADILASDSDSDLSEIEVSPAASSLLTGHTTLHLTVNIPPGHQGPITLQLDSSTINAAATSASRNANADAISRSSLARQIARSKPKSKKYAGFLDLPAELRNEIYRTIFVTEDQVNFANPHNFSRTAQLLRTCRQVYEEGRSILYSENAFTVERRTQRYGSLWHDDWRELGYLTVRKFIKSTGPANLGLIRHIRLNLEDAVPCLNPDKMTTDDRRFVNDDDLMSVLRHLGNHSQLQTLKLHFHGRRRVERTDDRFLDYIKRIKADEVAFANWPPASTGWSRESKVDLAVKNMLLTTCARKKKRFD